MRLKSLKSKLPGVVLAVSAGLCMAGTAVAQVESIEPNPTQPYDIDTDFGYGPTNGGARFGRGPSRAGQPREENPAETLLRDIEGTNYGRYTGHALFAAPASAGPKTVGAITFTAVAGGIGRRLNIGTSLTAPVGGFIRRRDQRVRKKGYWNSGAMVWARCLLAGVPLRVSSRKKERVMARSLIPFTDLPRPLHRLRQEMDRLFEDMFLPEPAFETTEMLVAPHLNVSETDKQYEITVELPGMDAKDISIEFIDGDLCISGEKKREEESDGKTFHRVERHYGRFCRRMTLASGVDQDNVQAEYKHGVLKVTVPKTKAAMPKRIEVKGE